MEIRRATRDDAPGIAQAHIDSWRAAYKGILADELLDALDVDERRATWANRIDDDREPDARVYVAEFDGEVGGLAFTQPCRDDDVASDGVAELTALYLRSAYLRRGAGSALAEKALDDLRGAGYEEVILWVLEENATARRFYERTGWEWDGARAPCFRAFNAPAVRYRRVL